MVFLPKTLYDVPKLKAIQLKRMMQERYRQIMPPIPLLKFHLNVQKSCCMVSSATRLKLFTDPPHMCAKNDPLARAGPIPPEQKIPCKSPVRHAHGIFCDGVCPVRGVQAAWRSQLSRTPLLQYAAGGFFAAGFFAAGIEMKPGL